MLPSLLKKQILLILLLWITSQIFGNTRPVLVMMDPELRGVGTYECAQLVDLFSYLLFERGEFIVIDRYERNKLLEAGDFYASGLHRKSVAVEAGNKLYADYVVTGLLEKKGRRLLFKLNLITTSGGEINKTYSGHFESVEDIVDHAREISTHLSLNPDQKPVNEELGFVSYFTPQLITERVLFVLPRDNLSDRTAGLKTLLNILGRHYTQSNSLMVFYTEADYDLAAPDIEYLRSLTKKMDCHSFILFTIREEKTFLSMYDERSNLKLNLPLREIKNIRSMGEALIRQFNKQRPLLAPRMILREINIGRNTRDKIKDLLFNEQLTNQHFMINVHQKITKEVAAQSYHLQFNIISLELDGYWHYNSLFGVGLGYGFSFSYPGQVGENLAHHPLVAQHEFRVTPLSLRVAGPVTIITNIFGSLNVHNVYELGDYAVMPERDDYGNERFLWFFKVGLNLGVIININKSFSFFIDTITFSRIFPLPLEDADLNDYLTKGRTYGSLGGLGIIYRF